MIGLADVRDWLKQFDAAEHYYIGKLDAKKEKSLGVYSRATTGRSPGIALGGRSSTKIEVKPVSLLLHWNNNARETEQAAWELYEALLEQDYFQARGTIGETARVNYLRLLVPEPVDVGTDAKGVYERVIWMDIYYENTERCD